MEFLSQSVTLIKLAAAVKVIQGTARMIHNDRPSHGLAYFYGGSATYRFSTGEVIRVEKGDCIYMPKHSFYTVEQSEGYDESKGCYAVNFQILEDGAFEPFKVRIKNTGDFLILFQNIERKNRHKSRGYTEICLSELYKVIYMLKNEYSASYFGSHKMSIITPAIDHIAKHLTSEDISVTNLAKLCGISESYLRRLFIACLGVSPVEYMRQRRLAFAKELLESGECSVSFAASSAGFNDISYFSREFKKFYKISPKDVKNV